MKGSSDGLSPVATSSPSTPGASEEEEIAKKEVDDGDLEWSNLRNRTLEKEVWGRKTPAPTTTENSSRCSSPCEDPLEREPEEREVRDDETEAPREALTAKSVREAALKNAAIDDEYNVKNVKNILHRLKAASLTLNNSVERVRVGSAEEDDGVEIVEKEKQFCEIVLESSDDEEDEVKESNEDDDDDIQVIANPNIKSLEKTQQMKVAEQLSSAGVTVKNSMPKVPKKLFPKWQTIAHLAPMEVPSNIERPVKEPPSIPRHLQRPIKVLSLFDGITGCLVALKQLGFTVGTYVSSETDEFSKIVTMIRHPEVAQVGDARGINEKVLREHGPFDLLVAGFPCNDFENESSIRNHKSGMHFQIFVEILRSCAKQHKKAGLSTPFHWLFHNVDLPQRHRDRISSALNCDPVKLDAIHISPMRKPDFFWSNIPGLETVLRPNPPLDRISLQECLEPDRVARVRRLNTLNVSFESMRQGQYDQVPINHGGEMDHLWMVEVERVLGFPNHYTDVANLPPKERLQLLSMSGSVPIFRHILTPLRRYYAHSGP